MRARVLALSLLLASTACTTTGTDGPSPSGSGTFTDDYVVNTGAGAVRGTTGKVEGVSVFKGIPFGAAPVGDLRWKDPQPVQPWSGVRDATRYGAPCIQNPAPQRTPVNSATDWNNAPAPSEDCLYLNVWTPAERAGEDLPVMVWLYGGAYNEGGGNAPFSEGDFLADKGVVLVTFNYRVGPFGFFAHPELTAESPNNASGNQALGDSVAVLQWIQDNIEQFGGDPDRVTIFGESAGAAMVGGLTGVPPARGLFHRGISQSGGWMGLGIAPMMPRERAEAMAVSAAQEAGADTLAKLRAMPAADVQSKLRGQGMIVDGYYVREDLSITFAEGRQNPVDIIAGSNGDEGSFTAAFGPPTTAEQWKAGAEQRWRDLAEEGLAIYSADTDEEARVVSTRPFTDTLGWHMRHFAEHQAKIGENAYTYYFTHVPPYDPGTPKLGAMHTAEIPYAFDNLAAPRTFPDRASNTLAAASAEDQALADIVSQYWVNFAATGNPNGPGLPQWPEVSALGPTETMVIDADGTGRGQWMSQEKLDFYRKMWERDVKRPVIDAAD